MTLTFLLHKYIHIYNDLLTLDPVCPGSTSCPPFEDCVLLPVVAGTFVATSADIVLFMNVCRIMYK